MILGKCEGLCAPTILYICLTIFSILMRLISRKSKANIVMSQILVSSLWTSILYILCSHCHERWAWALLTLPIILGLVLVTLLAEYMHIQNKKQDKKRENFEQYREHDQHDYSEYDQNEKVVDSLHQQDHPEKVVDSLHQQDHPEKDGPQPHEPVYVQKLDIIN